MSASCIPPPTTGSSVWGGGICWITGNPCVGWRHLLDHRHCVPFEEPSFTFGGQKSSLMAVTSLAHQQCYAHGPVPQD